MKKDKPPTMQRGETWVSFFYRYSEWAGGQMTNAPEEQRGDSDEKAG